MWDLYAQRGQGIAIQTTYAKLAAHLPAEVPSEAFIEGSGKVPEYEGKKIFINPSKVTLCDVRYIDWDKGSTSAESSWLFPFVHKRVSFQHEHEVRAVIQQLPLIEEKSYPDEGAKGHLRGEIAGGLTNPKDRGLSVGVSITSLIEKVVVAPKAPPWFGDLVENISAKYSLARKRVIKSPLYERPLH